MTLTPAPAQSQEGMLPPAPVPPRRRWVAIAAAALLVVAAAITTTVWVRHYRNAPSLTVGGFYGWVNATSPPGTRVRNVDIGPYHAAIITAWPGHVQSFETQLVNNTSVTQTVFGGRQEEETAEPIDVRFARPTGSERGDDAPKSERDFTETSATIAPGRSRAVRYSIHTTTENHVWKERGRQESFSDLYLRVRVGWSTRNEVIDLDDFAFVMESPKQVG